MIDIDRIVEKIGVRIQIDNSEDEILGRWIPEDNLILISPHAAELGIEAQVVAHEVIHAIDPACQEAQDDYDEVIRAELRAEYGAKLILGDAYIDDGTLDNLGAELNDVLGVLDEIEHAEELCNNF